MKQIAATLLFILLFVGHALAQPFGFPGTAGQLLGIGSTATTPLVAGNLLGDCTNSAFSITCTKLNGVSVTLAGPFATTGASSPTLAFPSSGSETYTFPASTSSLAALGLAQTWTALQTFNSGDLSATAPAFSGTFTGTYNLGSGASATTQTSANNSTSVATTAYTDIETGLTTPTTVSTTGGSTTLSAAQYGTPQILVTGALTSNATLVVPNAGRWSITNSTTGAFSVTVKTSGGTGLVVSQGYTSFLQANGTNIVDADSDYFNLNGYTSTLAGALDAYYAQSRKAPSATFSIKVFGDSLANCYQTDPGCSGYGPQLAGNRWPNLLTNMFLQAGVPIVGNGIQPCIGTVISASFLLQGPYTSTGTLTNSSLVGPSQATGALTGGSICAMGAGSTITYPAGHTFYSATFYCGQTTTTETITVTIGGTSVGSICGSTSGSPTTIKTTFNNPGGVTSAAIVMSAATAGAFYGLELQYTSSTAGVVIHNESAGAANSYFFGGNTTSNLGFSDLLSGSDALAIVSLGINDQAGNISAANFTTNVNFILNHEQARGASTMIANEYVWTGTGSTNASLRATNLTLAQQTSNPGVSDYVDFQDVMGPITPAQAYAMGLMQSDTTHETDLASLVFAQMIAQHLLLGRVSPTGGWSLGTNQSQGGYTSGYEAFQNSTDANPNFRIEGCFFASLVTCNGDHFTTPAGNWFTGLNGATAQTGVGGNGVNMAPGAFYEGFAAANGQTPTGYPLVIDPSSHLVSRPYNVIPLLSTYTSSGTAGTYTNVSDGTRTMQFALNATDYKDVHCDFTYGASATTVGVEFKWTYSGTMTLFHSRMKYDATTATAGAANLIEAPVVTAVATQQPTTPTVVNTTTAQYVIELDVHAYTSTAGTLILTAAPSATGTINFPAGECRIE